ncbi:YbhB/YbcL family Raf kinase inhibitor-like protein [Tatumella citrea]|uniref:YbhB/YbcL family Raf kinase inhibitor-like protein n=1 Tax=Tatumella citrea TaxID=53336 RepID=UPI001E3CBE01|nr:YbhB/YbcL family Raf kinase inhibitor-like protein [Tatumella citrea]
MKRSISWFICGGLLAISSVAAAAPFQLTSDNFKNGGNAPLNMGGGGQCPGSNISPQLSWHNAPAGTKSFVLMIEDPQGANGLGVMHFIGYGIEASRHQFASGELADSALYTAGINLKGVLGYSGPCPPKNADIHNYNFTVVATNLDVHALPKGLDKNSLVAKLKGHALGSAGIVAQYNLNTK